MDHRSVSLKFLRSTQLIPVKVRPGQKDPMPEFEPRTISTQNHGLVLKELETHTEFNLGALFSGRYVDLDIDSTTPYLHAALDYFLPRTPYVWGRKSKPRSHRVYALHEEFDRGPWGPTLRYLKALVQGQVDDESYSVELRGGKPENGLFSVLPGSIHPSGELVEWDLEIDPSVGGSHVELSLLVRQVRLAVAASILAPHWIPGQRNDLSLALAGTLWRIRTATRAAYGLEPNEEVEDPTAFVLSEDDAKALFGCVMLLAGDEPEDRRSRLLNLKNTWRKLDGEVGAKVTGGKVLGELIGDEVGPKAVKALYRLLSDNDAAEQIEKLAEQFVMWYGPGVLLDLDMVVKGRGVPWMTYMQAKASMGGKNIVMGQNKVKMYEMLFGSTIIQRVMGLTFNPADDELLTQTSEGLMVNQWRGWTTTPHDKKVTNDDVRPFIDYVNDVLCSGIDAQAHWVMAWIADLFRNPGNKAGTALVLVGVQGAGKSFLGEHVIGAIVGPTHYVQLKDVTKLTDKFNTIIDNKVFVQCDEAIHSYQKDVASRLKSIITDKTITVEPKGINAYSKPSHMRLLFTSNEETGALFIDPSPYERRFSVLKVSAHRARDLEYWSMMHAWTAANLSKIMRWLLDYEYDRHLVNRPVQTAAKVDIQRVGVDIEVSWILSRLADGFPLDPKSHSHWYDAFDEATLTDRDKREDVLRRDAWPDKIVLTSLEQDFRHFIRAHGRTVYTGNVIATMKKVLPKGALTALGQIAVKSVDSRTGQASHSRVRLYSWPSPSEIFEHLHNRYGSMVDELFEEVRSLAPVQGRVEEKEEF